MCRKRYPQRSETEVDVDATALAWYFTKEEVGAFEHEGQVTEQVLEEVVEAATKDSAIVAVCEIHYITTKEAVAKEVGVAAVRVICHEAAMAMLESVAREAAKVVVRELCHGVATREAAAWMYATDIAAEEACVADAAMVAAAWELVDDDKMKVEDSNDDNDEVVETKDGEECHAAAKLEECHRAKELIATVAAVELAEAEQAAHTEAEAERASNCASMMEVALAYRRDVDR
jgi:hypothetical protein